MDTHHIDYTHPPMRHLRPRVLRIPNQPPDVISKGYTIEPQDGAPPVIVLSDEQESAIQEHARQRDEVLGSRLIIEAYPVLKGDTATYEVKGLIVSPDCTDYLHIPVFEAGRHSRVIPTILDASFEVLLIDAKAVARVAQGYFAELANITILLDSLRCKG